MVGGEVVRSAFCGELEMWIYWFCWVGGGDFGVMSSGVLFKCCCCGLVLCFEVWFRSFMLVSSVE